VALNLVVEYTKGLRKFGGIVIDGIVGLDILFLVFMSVASMNPGRSLALHCCRGNVGKSMLYWPANFIETSLIATIFGKKI